MTFKVTWMAEDGEVSYSEAETAPEVGDIEEFDITVASFRQVVKVVDEEGTVPGGPPPDAPPVAEIVPDDSTLPVPDPAVEALPVVASVDPSNVAVNTAIPSMTTDPATSSGMGPFAAPDNG